METINYMTTQSNPEGIALCHDNIPCIELKKKKTKFPRTQILNIKDAEHVIRKFYSSDINLYESVFILLMDASNHTIGYAKISQGGIASSIVDPMLVSKYVVESLAKNCILAHNHPSGNLEPSEEDRKMTEKIQLCLQMFDSKLLDSIILTESGVYSILHNQ